MIRLELECGTRRPRHARLAEAPVKLVIDASVLVNAVVPQPLSDHAEALISRTGHELIAPGLCRIEAQNALWRYAHAGALTPDEALARYDLVTAAPVEFVETRLLEPLAFELALTHGHPVYDCLHLALALAEDAGLATADDRLHLLGDRVLGENAHHLRDTPPA